MPRSTTSRLRPRWPASGSVLHGRDHEVGVDAVGDEGLGAVDHVVPVLAPRAGRDAGQVRAGPGLGHRDRRDQLAGGDPRQPAVALLGGAVLEEVRQADVVVERHAEPEAAGVGQLHLLPDHDVEAEVRHARRRRAPRESPCPGSRSARPRHRPRAARSRPAPTPPCAARSRGRGTGESSRGRSRARRRRGSGASAATLAPAAAGCFAASSSSSREQSFTRGRPCGSPSDFSTRVDRLPARVGDVVGLALGDQRLDRCRVRIRRVLAAGRARRSSRIISTVSWASFLLVPITPVGPRLIQPTQYWPPTWSPSGSCRTRPPSLGITARRSSNGTPGLATPL